MQSPVPEQAMTILRYFLYDILYKTLSDLDCILSNVWMSDKDELKNLWMKGIVALSRYCTGICLVVLRNTTKNLNQFSQ